MINFLDIGCANDFDTKWHGLAPRLKYAGCDPNAAECERLNQSPPVDFGEHGYYPVAITPETKDYMLYETTSPPCSSLLAPNTEYLNRFLFSDLFVVERTSQVSGNSVADLCKQTGFLPDVLKMDVQGLELQVLESAPEICGHALVMDLDVGFSRNYKEEAVFWEISQWMEAHGFLLFDIDVNRVRRRIGNEHLDGNSDYINNDYPQSKSQPLWGNSIWIRDFLSDKVEFDSSRKAILAEICKHLHFHDYAAELSR